MVVPFFGQHLLEVVDLVVAGRPDLARDEAVDADHEDVLVVRAVEDPDLALARRVPVDPPQEVVAELLRGRDLERRDRAALRVECLHDLGDRAVLACGIDALEHDEDRVLRLRPHPVLEAPQALHLVERRRHRRLLVVAERRAGIHAFEVDA